MKLRKKIYLFTGVFLCLGLVFYFSQRCYLNFQQVKKRQLAEKLRLEAWQNLEKRLQEEIIQFKGISGVVVKDLGTGWEFSHNKDKKFAAASLTKIPIMASTFLAAKEGRVKLDRNITLKSTDKLSGSGTLKNLPSGTTFSVEKLIGLMIYDSDNTATNMVTNLAGIDYLQNSFKLLGLKNTNISRRVADYQARKKGIENYTTAEDMTFLLEQIYYRRLINRDISERCINLLKLTHLNDRIPKYLPADITVAHKTGLERRVCHDAGIVFTCRGDFIIVVLTKHKNSHSTLSKEFIAKMASYVYNYFGDLDG
jgi:beta-lactamase class A